MVKYVLLEHRNLKNSFVSKQNKLFLFLSLNLPNHDMNVKDFVMVCLIIHGIIILLLEKTMFYKI